MSFSLTQSFDGSSYTPPALYIDSLWEPYTFPVTIQADRDEDIFSTNLPGTISFEGDEFPLDGESYITEQSGTLSITVSSALAVGRHVYTLYTGSELEPAYGLGAYGICTYGAFSDYENPLETILMIQVLPAQLTEQLRQEHATGVVGRL